MKHSRALPAKVRYGPLILAFCGWLFTVAAHAVIETYEFSSPALEMRYHALSQELRCPKCQNQNIADSNAPIARDLRVVLVEQLEAGQSDEQILAFMVARYGEFVRYRPAVDRNTALLWWSPAILIGAGLIALVFHFRGRGSGGASALTASETAELKKLMKNNSP
jgi:cytochrome c-type biogenesis protein CcmH